jgi:hypothetical protein
MRDRLTICQIPNAESNSVLPVPKLGASMIAIGSWPWITVRISM